MQLGQSIYSQPGQLDADPTSATAPGSSRSTGKTADGDDVIPGRNCWGMVQDCSHPKLNVFQKDILQVHTSPLISAFFVNKLSKFLQLEV